MVDIRDFETTADGSMVKIDMTDPALRANEPAGKFVGVDQAITMEAQGLCVIRKKGRESSMINSHERVTVEYLEQALINSYGKFGAYERRQAELGEKMGKWKIVGIVNSEGQAKVYSEEQKQFFNFDERYQSKTKGARKQKVAWIQDDFMVGGAELSSRLVVEVGIDCGYSIDLITPSTGLSTTKTILGQSDFMVISNFWGFFGEPLHVILNAIYSERKPYVKYEHDHRELDRPEFSRRLFQNSKLNVFISPIHLKNHQEALACEGIVLPLAIDVDLFKQVNGIKREENTALVCNVRHFKSWTNLQKYIDDNQGIRFTVMAEAPQVRGQNVTARQMISPENMPELYSEFEYVVHLLDGWGAGERVIFEGALCGCKIVANERVGHMSWNKDLTKIDDLRDWLILAPYSFWKEVERKVLC